MNVVLVSRRQTVLDEVAATIASQTRTVAVDLSVDGADEVLAAATADLEVGLLIYNAGADPHSSRFLDRPLEVWQEMVRRNVNTVLGASYRYGKAMADRRRGGIVLVRSHNGSRSPPRTNRGSGTSVCSRSQHTTPTPVLKGQV